MSKENAKAFVQAVLNDEELRQRTGAMKPEELIPFAKEMGFDFTLDELKEVKKDDIELSPDELEAVAGGRDKVFDAMDNTKKFWKKLQCCLLK
jgi:predicted ribosomally synthesized peptide with nif11-like leader